MKSLLIKSLKKNNDAFGESLMAQFKDRSQNIEIVERDDGLITATDYAKTYFSEYRAWSEKERQALKLVKGRVLDVGCGAGRHALYLQSKGYDVTGIDNSPGAVKVSKKRGLKKAKLLSIEEVDKLKANSFDTIILLGNNFGLFGGKKQAKVILKSLYKVTSPEARIIAENRNPYKTKNPLHLQYHEFNRKRGRMSGQLRLRLRHDRTIGKWFDYLFVSPEEMKEILKGTGWKVSTIFDERDPVYLAVLEKDNQVRDKN
jgi:SAM-dependent methyltransferase